MFWIALTYWLELLKAISHDIAGSDKDTIYINCYILNISKFKNKKLINSKKKLKKASLITIQASLLSRIHWWSIFRLKITQ